MSAVKVSVFYMILFSMTVIGLKNHVTIIPALLQVGGRDSWMSVILSAVLLIPWLLLLLYIHKVSKQQSIKDWLKQTIGAIPASIIIYSVILFCILLAAFTMQETLLWINTTFLPETPAIVLLGVYTVLLLFLIGTNMTTLTIVNAVVLFGVVVFGFFVAFVNGKVKDIILLRPFLEHGWEPVLRSMIYPASGFTELVLLLFLQQHMKGPFRWYHFAIMLFILMGLTLGPLIGAITEFGPIEAAKQRYPAYEEWGLASLGRFIENVDFLSVYQWLTGTFIRVGLLLYIIVDLCNIAQEKKKIWSYIGPPFVIICLLLALLDDAFFLKVNQHYFPVITVIYLSILSIVLVLAAIISGTRRGNV